jgi:hypothetical protein
VPPRRLKQTGRSALFLAQGLKTRLLFLALFLGGAVNKNNRSPMKMGLLCTRIKEWVILCLGFGVASVNVLNLAIVDEGRYLGF